MKDKGEKLMKKATELNQMTPSLKSAITSAISTEEIEILAAPVNFSYFRFPLSLLGIKFIVAPKLSKFDISLKKFCLLKGFQSTKLAFRRLLSRPE